jgi:hypothetical protein
VKKRSWILQVFIYDPSENLREYYCWDLKVPRLLELHGLREIVIIGDFGLTRPMFEYILRRKYPETTVKFGRNARLATPPPSSHKLS